MFDRVPVLILVILASALTVACKDKAEPAYAACIQADTAGDVKTAWDSCNVAIAADPNSTSGKAAAAKLAAMKPAYDKWKADADAKAASAAAAQAKQDEANRQAAKDAAEARIRTLRAKVRRTYPSEEPDGTCQGKGLPPYLWEYQGGTYAENGAVAAADGCKVSGIVDTAYCCPRKPLSF
jgi:multidrug efflux pump subunit AcrA (membrane-fusion protein)